MAREAVKGGLLTLAEMVQNRSQQTSKEISPANVLERRQDRRSNFLAYDHSAILGKDASVPIERAAHVLVPTLVMNGSASYPFMYETAQTLSKVIPHAQLCTLEGQDHGPADEVLAPALKGFFLG